MYFRLPDVKRALVIAPHPDDEALGCAGSIIQAVRNGTSVSAVYVTDGECLLGEPSRPIAQKRTSEARIAAEALGCENTCFLSLPDGRLASEQSSLYDEILLLLDKESPELVFAPSPLEYHEDHRAVSKVILKLLQDAGGFSVAFYEVYATIRFTHLVDITEVIAEKKKAIEAYTTSLYDKPEKYVHTSLGLNAHRSMFCSKKGYYEAFWVLDAPVSTGDVVDWLTYGFSG